MITCRQTQQLTPLNMTAMAPATQKVLRPDHLNVHGPYFPQELVHHCGNQIKKILKHFEPGHILQLIHALKSGSVNGCFEESDLMGTLAKILETKREDLYKKIGIEPNQKHNWEYWMKQICNVRVHRTPKKALIRCLFTEITIGWCKDVRRRKTHSTRTRSRITRNGNL